MDFGVTVLPGLGGGHFDDLAGTVLDDDETVLPQGGTLHRVGQRGASIGALERVLMLQRWTLASGSLGVGGHPRCLGAI